MSDKTQQIIKKLGQTEGIIEYLNQVNTQFNQGLLSAEKTELRIQIAEEIQQLWNNNDEGLLLAGEEMLEAEESIYDRYPEEFVDYHDEGAKL